MDPKQRNLLALALVVVLVGLSWWQFWPLDTNITQGLDIKGGLSVILTAEPTANETITEDAMSRVSTILANRVNGLGVSEATVQRQGADSFLVQLPGVKDSDEALKALRSTGRLDFVPAASISTTAVLGYGVQLPEGSYEASAVIITGASVTRAATDIDTRTNQPAVTLGMDPTGTKAWADFTSTNVGKQVVIVLDGIVQSAPVVNEPILTGDTQISGSFTAEEAKRLAAVLQAGALPVNLAFSESRVVGPTLGQDSLRQGLLAGMVGLALVMVFMALYYRGLGVISWFSLGFFASIFLGVLALLSRFGAFALSLPGIAGMVLTVGLAADSSILMFERFKEEVRMGKTFRSAARSSTRHALLTSVDADVVTLVSALMLYMIAIGPVKGFALTLMIGIAIDLTVAFLFTRPAIIMLAESVVAKKPFIFGMKGADTDA
ncbi:MAG: protein translocase subunit SecD [Coriobacteriia bacterium]|nr:protein translocase subunit SecD [Coriobacteriia bacterium]